MNIFSRIKDAVDNHRIERLRRDLMKIQNNDFVFDPFKVYMPEAILAKTYDSTDLIEFLCWYSANGTALRQFYKSTSFPQDSDRASFFWNTAMEDMRKVHCGLPLLISEKMSTILFGNGYDVNPIIYKIGEDGKPTDEKDDKQSKRVKDLIDQILSEMKFSEKLNLAGQAESWSGHIAFKLNYDFSLSPFPIIQVVDRRYFSVIKEQGITKDIIFRTFYEKTEGTTKVKYRLDEDYTTDVNGYALIETKLYKLSREKAEEVPLTTIQETADIQPEIKFNTQGMLAFEKPNLLLSSAFNNYPYGKSDYKGAVSVFDSLDEIVTAIVAEIRDNKTIRFIDESYLQLSSTDSEAKFGKINKYITNFVKTSKGNAQGSEPIESKEFKDKTEDHMNKYKILISEACNICGLSPISLGITGLESISSSDKSTRERCKTTIETRNEKLKLWIPFLKTMILRTLEFASELQKTTGYPTRPGIPQVDIDYNNCDVNVTFADYVSNSVEERINTWGGAKQTGVASTEMAVRKIHGDDLTDAEIISEVNAIKFETGTSIDSPTNLLNMDDIQKELPEKEKSEKDEE